MGSDDKSQEPNVEKGCGHTSEQWPQGDRDAIGPETEGDPG
jgi:hypothetical protein